jgi:hypothetical protein
MGKRKSYHLTYPDIKKKKQCRPYAEDRSYPTIPNFWDSEQKEIHDHIYSTLDVFQHKYVNWSDVSDLGNVLSEKYENLGLKDLISYNPKWNWSEDTVRQFYGTLFINSNCTEMEFIIDSVLRKATKKDFEEALGINPRDENFIVLHSLPIWKEDNADACSLYVVPTISSKEVCHLKPEVDLIQKICRWTLLPKIGAQGDCTDMLLKLAHAIYHEKHFDVAHFLLCQMCIALETSDALPYGHYISCLLHHLELIPKEIIGESSLLKYSPEVMERPVVFEEVVNNMVELYGKFDDFRKCLDVRLDTFGKRLERVESLHHAEVQRRKDWEKRFTISKSCS